MLRLRSSAPVVTLALALALALATGGCSGDPSTITGETVVPGATTTSVAAGTSPTPTAAPDPTTTLPSDTSAGPDSGAACVSGNVPFTTEDGVAAAFGDTSGDASTISGLRWSLEGECERFVIDLSTSSGSPASTVGRTTVHLQAGRGIVRVDLPAGVDTSSIADAVIDGDMITAAYVVDLIDGSLAVDLHLSTTGSVEVRAFPATSPVRIVVDLRPTGSGPSATSPAVAGDLVVVTPRDGPADYPLDVTGYVRSADIDVGVFLDPESPDRLQGEVTVANAAGTWSEFRTIFDEGPTGTVELQVATGDGAADSDVVRVLLALE